MLGIREPNIYGKASYSDLVELCKNHCEKNGITPVFYQSNHEGDLVDKIQEAYFEEAAGIVINPGAYTHTSIALLDAVKSVGIPTVEVHISDPDLREDFRKTSYIRAAVKKSVKGHGFTGYLEAIDFIKELSGNES